MQAMLCKTTVLPTETNTTALRIIIDFPLYKGWAFSALALQPTVVYCASPFDYSLSNPALRMKLLS
jgi:hypothetical protein